MRERIAERESRAGYFRDVEYVSPPTRMLATILRGVRAPTAGSMLDVGCGGGDAAAYALEHEMDYCGVDYAASRVSRARQLYGYPGISLLRPAFVTADVYEMLPAMNRGYDLVWCGDLLDRLEHPDRVWGEMQRLATKMIVAACRAGFRFSPDPARLHFFRRASQIRRRFPGARGVRVVDCPDEAGVSRSYFVFTWQSPE